MYVSRRCLIERIASDKQEEEHSQRSINQQQFLIACHAVCAQSVLLVLCEARHHLDTALKVGLGRAADGAVVV